MSQQEAMQHYLELLTKLSPKWETGEGTTGKREKWICSSTLGFEEDKYVTLSAFCHSLLARRSLNDLFATLWLTMMNRMH
jgi:hypothetical protein